MFLLTALILAGEKPPGHPRPTVTGSASIKLVSAEKISEESWEKSPSAQKRVVVRQEVDGRTVTIHLVELP